MDKILTKNDLKLKRRKQYRQIIALSIPILGQSIFEPIMMWIDTFITGNFLGTDELGSITIATSITQALIGIFVFMIYTTNVTVATAFGANKRSEGLRAGLDSVFLSLIIGGALSLFLYFAAPFIIGTFHSTTEVYEGGVAYMRGYALGVTQIMISMSLLGILRGMRLYKIPVYTAIASCIINAVLSYMLGVMFGMGLFGVALSTTIGNTIGMIIFGVPFARALFVEKVRLNPSLTGLKGVMKTGAPIFIRTVALWGSITFLMYQTAFHGTEFIAACQVLDAILVISYIFLDAIAMSIQTIISEQIGAKSFDEANDTFAAALHLGLYVGTGLFVFMCASAPFLCDFFTNDTNLYWYIVLGTVEEAVCMWHFSVAFITDGALIAAEDGWYLSKVILVAMAIFIPLVSAVSLGAPSTPIGFLLIWIPYDFVFNGTRAIGGFRRYKTGDWLKKYL
ncbi:MAG: MATE family efflux transporter [Bifidobacteriaceae bacterium]|jgi:putative MATE family efflux protein|nr:MATE family efflux transporter [Bifidobacteriaceae bacterium]